MSVHARRLTRLLLTAALASVSLTAARAAPVTLELQEGPGTRIPPLAIGGFNYGNWMPIVDAQAAVKTVAPTSLRFPAGNFGDDNDLTEASLLAFKAQLSLVGGDPALLLQTRAFATHAGARNTPEDAAAAARHARDLGLKVAYWEIGNEPDLYSTNRGDPSWTPEKYCDVFRAQRAAILNVDPTAKFAGPGVSGAEPRPGDVPRREQFLRGFLKVCGDAIDMLTWHEYPTDGSKSDEFALGSSVAITENAGRFRALLKDPQANPLGYRKDIRLGVTEYGLSWKTSNSRHLTDMVAAQWTADATLRLAHAGVDVASYFALLATGGHGLLDLAAFPRPTLYAFQQLRHMKGNLLPVQSSDPAVWTHAARDGNTLQVLVSNTAAGARDLTTTLPGWTLTGAEIFTAEHVEDEAEPTSHEPGATIALPARSMTRLAYRRTSSP